MRNFIFLGIAVIILAVVFLPRISQNVSNETLTSQSENSLETRNWEHYEFQEVGLSFSAPFEMDVTGEMIDENAFTLYVQKGEYTEGEEYYQLYGMYNLNDKKDVARDDLKTELNSDSIEETTISGFEAVKGQYKGERNRFVTFIITDRGLLTLATSQPTEENKLLTDQILETLVIN